MDVASIFTLVGVAALVWKGLDCYKLAEDKNWKGVRNQVATWVLGIVAVVLLSQTNFADFEIFNGHTLEQLNFWSLVYLGLNVSSFGSVGYDFKRAIDQTDSARTSPPSAPS